MTDLNDMTRVTLFGGGVRLPRATGFGPTVGHGVTCDNVYSNNGNFCTEAEISCSVILAELGTFGFTACT